MATSKVEICNSALAKIGAQGISDLSDASPAAFLCNQLYDTLRKEVLRSHPWNFAIKRQSLTVSPTAPVWGFARAFPLPANCLRVLETEEEGTDWQKEDHDGTSAIVTDASSCKIKFIYDVEDVALFDANFCESLAFRIASDLAIPLTSQNSLAESMETKYRRSVAQARSFDGQEGTPQQVQANQWLASRY